jgi:hypothetical protein
MVVEEKMRCDAMRYDTIQPEARIFSCPRIRGA